MKREREKRNKIKIKRMEKKKSKVKDLEDKEAKKIGLPLAISRFCRRLAPAVCCYRCLGWSLSLLLSSTSSLAEAITNDA